MDKKKQVIRLLVKIHKHAQNIDSLINQIGTIDYTVDSVVSKIKIRNFETKNIIEDTIQGQLKRLETIKKELSI